MSFETLGLRKARRHTCDEFERLIVSTSIKVLRETPEIRKRQSLHHDALPQDATNIVAAEL
ncbi:hypothetical protein DRA46_02809 [Burkholderia gladioli]|nr:hypothetical protein [Burkholderia gladioli]